MFSYSADQLSLLQFRPGSHIFLEGPAGSGKTAAGIHYLRQLILKDIDPGKILVITPQRSLGLPYQLAMTSGLVQEGRMVETLTMSGLARRMIHLFWPLIAAKAGFARPDRRPIFLTMETAQYHANRLFSPLLEKGFFSNITIDRNRIFSQVLDNLNKSALVGFSHLSIGERLKTAWVGKPEQIQIYNQVQECASLFRSECLKYNLLDFSLQIVCFIELLFPSFLFRQFIFNQYSHLIYDNIEEDAPIFHDVLKDWLKHLDGSLLIFDTNSGYRTFLGADPQSGYSLKDHCSNHVEFNETFNSRPGLQWLRHDLQAIILKRPWTPQIESIEDCMQVTTHKFIPQMVKWVCDEIDVMVNEKGCNPGEIAILSPYLSDAMRFSFSNSLDQKKIPFISHRPSRTLRDEPAAQCLLALGKLCHPELSAVTMHEFRLMLTQSIEGFDLIRADILAKTVFRPGQKNQTIGSFDAIQAATQDRITHTLGERYESLREWILSYRKAEALPLDIFIRKAFGEILSQPGFGFHKDFESANISSRLIESIEKFRQAWERSLFSNSQTMTKEYIEMINAGVIAAQYIQPVVSIDHPAILIAPAYTFLMENRSVRFQFWLDIGSMGWWERLNQPLTHPYVLSRHWIAGQKWTDKQEYETNQSAMSRLVNGLITRCKEKIYFCAIQINEQGNEQRGPFIQAIQTFMRKTTLLRSENV